MREEKERWMKRRVRNYSNKIEPPLNLTDFQAPGCAAVEVDG